LLRKSNILFRKSERVIYYWEREKKWYIIEKKYIFDITIKHSIKKFVITIEKDNIAVKKSVFAVKKVIEKKLV